MNRMKRIGVVLAGGLVEPGAGGDVTPELAAQMEAVTGELVDLAGRGNLILIVQAGAARDLHSVAARYHNRDVKLL